MTASPDSYMVSVNYMDNQCKPHYKVIDVPGEQVTHDDDRLCHVNFRTPDTDLDGITAGDLKVGAERYEAAIYADALKHNLPLGNYDDPSQFIGKKLPVIDNGISHEPDSHFKVKEGCISTYYDNEFGSVSTVYFPIRVDDTMYDAEQSVHGECVDPSDENGFDVDIGPSFAGYDVIFDEDEHNRLSVAYEVLASNIVELNEAAKAYEKEQSRENDRGHEFDDSLLIISDAVENEPLPFWIKVYIIY